MVSTFTQRVSAAWRAWTLGTCFVLVAASSPAAQLGHVVKAQKISDTSGGFSAVLDEQDQFGRSIVNLGDLDGDGISDLLVGAHTDDDGGLDQGAVYILFLRANGFVKAWQKISDLSGNFSGYLGYGDQFGRAAANLGDVDGDGVVDVAVSANYDDDGGTNKGAVYILFLRTDGTVKSVQKISSTQGGLPATLSIHDEFGRSITSLGDLDGDGVTDIVVGTPEDDEGGTNTGALHVLFLNRNGTVKAYHRISKFSEDLHIKPGDWFGHCSANIGDFDHDGVTDIAVGAVLDDDGGVNQGAVWILFLRPDGSVKESHEINELVGGFTAQLDDIDQFGTAVSSIGDLDGDGVTDIAVGAVKDDDGGTPGDPDADVGATYILFLKPDATVKSWVKISDTSGDLPYPLDQWDWFGSALAPLGGSSGDGLFNLAIGCRYDNDGGGNHGAIYLVQLNDGSAPAADFGASKTLGVAPMSVSFSDTSTGEVTAWLWNFGDGPQSNLQNPVKTYDVPGTYDVQLTTRGPKGTDSLTRDGFITVSAGPLAEFTAAPRTGPCPLAVSFSDLSEGQVTSWVWTFGDGSGSNVPSPSHVYAECGRYDVSLTVTGPQGTHTQTATGYVVAALQPPAPDFTAQPSSGSAPLTVQFADASSGQVTAWSWDFGDGTGSSAQNPSHAYALVGSYTVTLTASGPGGSATKTAADLVTVTEPAPSAAFDADPTTGPEPLTVVFTDATTGQVSGWHWDFGDGSSADERNPVHVYPLAGVYSVALTATGSGGSDTRSVANLVHVEAAPPGAAFGAAPTSGVAPLAVQFSDLSTLSVTSWSWDFGDGTSASVKNPAHVYANAGSYTVTLTVAGPGGSDTLALAGLINVSAALTQADFSSTPPSGAAPLSVSFTDLSSPNVSAWSWDFGDGAGASVRNPAHVYVLPGTYAVTLTVTSATGTGSVTHPACVSVLEAPPVASFVADVPSGDVPLSVNFSDQSLGNVTARSWDFGDGQGASVAAPTHVYTVAGSYAVSLTVSGPGGSDTQLRPEYISATDPTPKADFSAQPTSGVAPLAVQFSDASSGNVSTRSWNFGDGSSSTLTSPAHVYSTPGTYTVTLTAAGPAGSDVESKSGLIVVVESPPAAGFGAAPTAGSAPLAVQFSDASQGAVSTHLWSFGDGSSSTLASPAHVYATPGTYSVALTVTGPGGTDTKLQSNLIAVTEPAPVAGFAAAPTSGDAPLTVQFTDASTGNVSLRSWDFGDGTSATAASPVHVYTAAGTYTVSLTVTGPGGSDNETKANLISVATPAPTAGFNAAPTVGAAPLSVQFNDTSTGQVSLRTWDFGDGTTSTQTSPLHVYTQQGSYTVSLTVIGLGGKHVDTKPNLISVLDPAPVANFTAAPTTGLAPLAVQFGDASSGAITSRAWSFGDGATSSATSPAHVYSTSGTYTVTLTVSGPGGSDGETKSSLITVVEPAPVASFTAAPTAGVAPLAVQFDDASSGNIAARSWSFGDGASSTATNPSHIYTAPGSFSVTLAVSGPGGSDGETRPNLVTVLEPPPVAAFSAAPTAGVAPLAVQFSDASSGNIAARSWSFGDGSSSSATSPLHVYATAGSYTVTLTTSGPGGSDIETEPALITVAEPAPVAGFGAGPTTGVAPLTVQFGDASSGTITTRAWDFGDGSSSEATSPAHVYGLPGTYSVTLTVTGPGGTDLEQATDLVHVAPAPPSADFSASPREGYAPLPVAFADLTTGTVTSWAWDFGDGTDSPLENPLHLYETPATYTVTLQVSGPGGKSSRRRPVTVQEAALFADGSFEGQIAGQAPQAPWSVFSGNHVLIEPGPVASDNGFPSAGALWCEVGAEGTSAATPPSNPLGEGLAPKGCAGIQQDFAFPFSAPHLFFDAAFVLNGAPATSARNDFMSVDLGDGVHTWNVFYADSFSDLPRTSSQYGLPMTEPRAVHVDLLALFPAADASTVLRMRVSVGNVGNATNPSRGYVDGFRLEPSAAATFRNGHGLNPALYAASPAVLGGSWSVSIDTSLRPGTRLVIVCGRTLPLAGLPLFGGEALIGGAPLFSFLLSSAGASVEHSWPIPADAGQIGILVPTQAFLFGGGVQPTNAYDLRLGY